MKWISVSENELIEDIFKKQNKNVFENILRNMKTILWSIKKQKSIAFFLLKMKSIIS